MTGTGLMPRFSKKFVTGNALDVLVMKAGLSANLQMCFDAGCLRSWAGSGNWLDISGHGYAFAPSGVAFSGTVGSENAAACFLYNGSSFFQNAAANDAFLDSLHKFGSTHTVVAFFTHVAGLINVFLSTTASSVLGTALGIMAYMSGSANQVSSFIYNGSSGLQASSTNLGVNGQVNITGLGRQVISNTNRNSLTYLNGTYNLTNSVASFVPSAAAGAIARIGSVGNNGTISANGARIHGLAVFDRLLTQAELDALRATCQRRWPTI